MTAPALPRAVRAAADAEAMRARILDAAERVFARCGYAAATTQELAAEAGIQKRMLFYYFASKDEVYERVLERLLVGIQAIHGRFREEPGPDGLADFVAALVRAAAARPEPVLILIREIIDEGPHLDRLAERWVAPLFRAGRDEVRRNVERGVFAAHPADQVLSAIGGLALFQILTAPLARRVTGEDPLSPDNVERQVAVATHFALAGLQGRRPAAATSRKRGRE
ncbi:MAG TPA: helix-turn-helix domain-containing protein [Candidatus Limnocylindria bacterium]|nr:helix-turn-helix domain-containing protein [Candidatus Limnocylindria bacterium]